MGQAAYSPYFAYILPYKSYKSTIHVSVNIRTLGPMHPIEAMRLSFPAEDWASCVAYLPETLDKVRKKIPSNDTRWASTSYKWSNK